MTDDLKDWNEFIDNTLRHKAVEKAKQIRIHHKEEKSENRVVLPKTFTIPHNTSLEREITLNDKSCVERKLIKQIRNSTIHLDGVIDLHGYSVDEAYNVFYNSFAHAVHLNLSSILVITGKGSTDKPSIRSQLIHWLNIPEISSNIVYFSQASYKHGGEGAFYILLRKKK